MRLVSIIGARPQFIKIAPVVRALESHNRNGGKKVEDVIVHTGQHYDAGMSDVFFRELGIPEPAFNLGVGSGSHGSQTGQMLERIEEVLLQTRPDSVVIYGDTNSTVAGALAAAKLHIPVAHVEAGVRSFNRRMPEEINRVVSDHVSDLLLAPTLTAIGNLKREGLAGKAVFTGDVMYDAVLSSRELIETKSRILETLQLTEGRYGVVTIHRAENTDVEERLGKLLVALNQVATDSIKLVFPVHPRIGRLLKTRFPGWSPAARLQMIEPIGYLDMLRLIRDARLTLTDSGGMQKEAFFLGCPCITLRDETEWVETVAAGANVVVGVEPDRIREAVVRVMERNWGVEDFSAKLNGCFGDGRAAYKIRDALLACQDLG